jgi:Domain of unknown function (DUF4214)
VEANRGLAFSGKLATFTDQAGPQPVSQYLALINWGDGSTATLGTIQQVGTAFEVLGSHAYAREGTYQVRVTIRDDPGNTATAFSLANVEDPLSTFVASLYRSLFDRAPDPGGLQNWLQVLRGGVSREQLARFIWASAEHRALQVRGYYETFLHREPEAGGQDTWMRALLSGVGEAEVQRGFLESDEYRQAHSDDNAFVTGLYQDVLGRNPDPSGLSAWKQALQAGMTRGQVAQNILTSRESYLRTLDHYYQDFLHRSADSAGWQAWLRLLEHGDKTVESVGEAFLGSEEYFALVGT